jgi:[protein-PII] uridylyltransferase
MARLEQLDALMLAALLHDVGKPLGSGHASKGARLAAGVAARLGLSARQQEDVRFLVAQHLLMAHLSQRRDLTDPAVIGGFCRRVETVDRLRQLYLLTLADTAMTAPGNLTEWKASLLDELYVKAYTYLSQGASSAGLRLEAELSGRRDALELALRRRFGPEAAEVLPRVPDELVLSYELEELLHHLDVALELERSADSLLRLRARPLGPSTTELTICCADSPGRLALITGVLLAHGVEVLGAQVYTLGDDGGSRGPATVLDVFTVAGSEEARPQAWQRVSADLERALEGTFSVADLVARHTRPSALGRRVTPHVQTLVSIDNGASSRFTVIDVQAPDRLGVLYAITRTLSELGLTIHLSRVATEAGRVIDNFYVSDGVSGAKVVDEERLDRVRERVTDAIEELR